MNFLNAIFELRDDIWSEKNKVDASKVMIVSGYYDMSIFFGCCKSFVECGTFISYPVLANKTIRSHINRYKERCFSQFLLKHALLQFQYRRYKNNF